MAGVVGMEETKWEFFILSLFCALDTNRISIYVTRSVLVLRFLAWSRVFHAGLGALLNALRICFLALAIFDRRNVLSCASSLGAACAMLVLAF